MKTLIFIFQITILCFFFFVGCHSKKRNHTNSSHVSEPKIKLHEIEVEVKRDQLSPSQIQLISQIDEKKIVDQDLLLEIILETHKEEFLKSGFQAPGAEINPPLIGYFDSLLGSMSQDTGPHEFKTTYEKNLLDQHGGQPMKYNKTHTSVFSPIFANRMQCYSGTVLFNLLYGRLKKSAFFETNQVFIYEDGHVLPGYMSEVDSQWHLFGVETTLGGSAKKIYGPTSGLKGVRVVDAHLALGIEALKSQITNRASVLKTTLEKTAELYEIPLEQIEGSLSNVSISMDGTLGSGTTTSDTSSYLNSSLFSFGDSSQVPSGDQDRETIEEFTAKPGTSGSRILSHPGNWKNEITVHSGTTGGILPGNQSPLNTTVVTDSFQHPFSDNNELVFIKESDIFYIKGSEILNIKQGLKHLFNPDVPIDEIIGTEKQLRRRKQSFDRDLQSGWPEDYLKNEISRLREKFNLLLANKESLQFWESLTAVNALFSAIHKVHYEDEWVTSEELKSVSWDLQVIGQHTCHSKFRTEERKYFWSFSPGMRELDSHSIVKSECERLTYDELNQKYDVNKVTKYGFISGFSQRKGMNTIEMGILSGATVFGKIELSEELSATNEPGKKVDLIFTEGR